MPAAHRDRGLQGGAARPPGGGLRQEGQRAAGARDPGQGRRQPGERQVDARGDVAWTCAAASEVALARPTATGRRRPWTSWPNCWRPTSMGDGTASERDAGRVGASPARVGASTSTRASASAPPPCRSGRPHGPGRRRSRRTSRPPDDAADAKARTALAALATVAADLRARGAAAGGATADVLEAQAMMAEDPGLADGVTARTDAGKTAARAIHEAFARVPRVLRRRSATTWPAGSPTSTTSPRARSPSPPACRCPGCRGATEPYVLVAADLAPADTALLDRRLVLALVTAEGGPTSHTAILARATRHPGRRRRRRGAGAGRRHDGAGGRRRRDRDRASVDRGDGGGGRARVRRDARRCRAAPGRAGRPTARAVKLLANIGGADDVPAALAAGAEGVGLFRTEFLYLGSDAAAVASRPRSRRTEMSSTRSRRARGSWCGPWTPARTSRCRSCRWARSRTRRWASADCGRSGPSTDATRRCCDTQLLAIREAAADAARAEVWVMAPMVAEVTEADWFCDLAAACGLDVAGGRVGIMVETPAAALTAAAILAGRTGLRLDRHQRPDAVHDGRRPDARRARGVAGPVASGGAAADRRGRRRPGSRPASRSGCAARRRPTRCWPACWSGSGCAPCRWRPRRSRRCGRRWPRGRPGLRRRWRPGPRPRPPPGTPARRRCGRDRSA